MSVELLAMNGADNILLEKVPALLSEPVQAGATLAGTLAGKFHCLISRIEDGLVVWDLGSESGTLVNGVPVTKANLHAGDTLTLGGTDFAVKVKPEPQRYLYGPRC
jgi:hypothetical protein